MRRLLTNMQRGLKVFRRVGITFSSKTSATNQRLLWSFQRRLASISMESPVAPIAFTTFREHLMVCQLVELFYAQDRREPQLRRFHHSLGSASHPRGAMGIDCSSCESWANGKEKIQPFDAAWSKNSGSDLRATHI